MFSLTILILILRIFVERFRILKMSVASNYRIVIYKTIRANTMKIII